MTDIPLISGMKKVLFNTINLGVIMINPDKKTSKSLLFFPFFINVQVYFFSKNEKKISNKIDRTCDIHTAGQIRLVLINLLLCAASAHDDYLSSTKSFCGFFKSFIPKTKENKIRQDCAMTLAVARDAIQKIEKKLKI